MESLTRETLTEIASKLDDPRSELSPMQAAAAAFKEDGLDDALENAQRDAEQFKTAWHHEVVAILEAVYENDPPQPNDCDECGRSYGPNYRGPCEHLNS